MCHISPMALYRLVCALGQQSLVPVLTRCGLPLPVYFLADEKHSRCLTEKVYLPTIVSGRVIWHLGYSESRVRPPSRSPMGRFNARPLQQEPSYQVRGALTDGFDSTTKSMRTLFPGARLGYCLRHALNKLPDKLIGLRPRCARRCAPSSTPCCTGADSAKAYGCLRWANGYATLPTTSPPRWDEPMASAYGTGFRERKRAGMRCSKTRRCRRPARCWIKPTTPSTGSSSR